jgi:hypothetical protein
MEKKLSKSEELAKLAALVSNRSQLGNFDWEFIYDMIVKYPRDARSVLEDHQTLLYDRRFRKCFEMYDKDPEYFIRHRIIPQLIIGQTRNEIEVLEVNQYKEPPNDRSVMKLKLGIFHESSFQFDVELTSYISGMSLRSLSPLSGIRSGSSHIPYFANPFLNGYMQSNFTLTPKGLNQLNIMIDEIYNILKMIMKDPAFALGLYTLVYDEVKRVNENAEYGKLKTFGENYDIMLWANRVTLDKLGVSSSYPGDLVESIQNVINHHPDIFIRRFN